MKIILILLLIYNAPLILILIGDWWEMQCKYDRESKEYRLKEEVERKKRKEKWIEQQKEWNKEEEVNEME